MIETIVVPVGKTVPAFHLQTDIIFGFNGGAKVNKFFDCIKSVVIDNIYLVVPSFIARPIIVDSLPIALKAAALGTPYDDVSERMQVATFLKKKVPF